MQAPSIENDENVHLDEPTEWLHRNDNYKRRSGSAFRLVPAICTKGASASASQGATQ